ncbi:DUF1993 domain-containing protein [Phenylobacterium sp.]|uniref:DUF1993 domain-containing protein n=1 Tax=Phenylobacterium sp. TaxID=1871053 RepID=UPI002BB82239|nr:DUF1993 domain-containing protein [Phenylobacterium sp.]HLZ77628.1 DUF1993 domain-containing protein [Phenylobacterium sp.]
MTVSLYTFVDLYARQLVTLEHLLNKGAEFAKAQGGSEEAFLDWSLIEDMQPFRFQAMVLCNFTRQWTARVIGADVPPAIDADLDLAAFRAAIADAKAWLAALTPEQFAGRDDAPLTVEIGNGMTPTLPAGQWLTVFATTNLYFHLSTAYGILRSKGVQIGKVDLFAGGL